MQDRYRELNFYKASVKIRIEGFRLDRLLDKAMRAGLNIKDVHLLSDMEVTCRLSSADLKRLRKLGGSLYRITVLRRQGPKPRLLGFLRQPLKVIGCSLAVALIVVQSLFIQSIEVNGYRGIPEEALLRCLARAGIEKGTFRPSVDWDKAENAVFRTFPEVTWVQLVYSGRHVILNISETDHKIAGQEQEDETESQADETSQTYANIIATKSGYVERINPYYGVAQAEPGDFVKKGQVLISGCVPIEPTTFEENAPKAYYVRAEGEVWGRVPYRLTFRQERYVWGSLSGKQQASAEGGEKTKTIASRIEKSEEEAKERVMQQIRVWIRENLPENAEILNKSLNFSRKENIIIVGVTLEVKQQIGITQEEFIGETDQDPGRDRQN